jgi:hypothetical protein
MKIRIIAERKATFARRCGIEWLAEDPQNGAARELAR